MTSSDGSSEDWHTAGESLNTSKKGTSQWETIDSDDGAPAAARPPVAPSTNNSKRSSLPPPTPPRGVDDSSSIGSHSSNVYIRADGKKVRRIKKRRSGTASGNSSVASSVTSDDETTLGSMSVGSVGSGVYIRADGKKVRRVKRSKKKKKPPVIDSDIPASVSITSPTSAEVDAASKAPDASESKSDDNLGETTTKVDSGDESLQDSTGLSANLITQSVPSNNEGESQQQPQAEASNGTPGSSSGSDDVKKLKDPQDQVVKATELVDEPITDDLKPQPPKDPQLRAEADDVAMESFPAPDDVKKDADPQEKEVKATNADDEPITGDLKQQVSANDDDNESFKSVQENTSPVSTLTPVDVKNEDANPKNAHTSDPVSTESEATTKSPESAEPDTTTPPEKASPNDAALISATQKALDGLSSRHDDTDASNPVSIQSKDILPEQAPIKDKEGTAGEVYMYTGIDALDELIAQVASGEASKDASSIHAVENVEKDTAVKPAETSGYTGSDALDELIAQVASTGASQDTSSIQPPESVEKDANVEPIQPSGYTGIDALDELIAQVSAGASKDTGSIHPSQSVEKDTDVEPTQPTEEFVMVQKEIDTPAESQPSPRMMVPDNGVVLVPVESMEYPPSVHQENDQHEKGMDESNSQVEQPLNVLQAIQSIGSAAQSFIRSASDERASAGQPSVAANHSKSPRHYIDIETYPSAEAVMDPKTPEVKKDSECGQPWQATGEVTTSTTDPASTTPNRRRLPEILKDRVTSRADVDAFVTPRTPITPVDASRGGHMICLNDDEDADAFIMRTAFAKKRVRVVQLLIFGLIGLAFGFLGSFYVQSSCHFLTATVSVGGNAEEFELYYGLWKYTPLSSAFEGYSYCYKYDGQYTNDSPVWPRVVGIAAILLGMYTLGVLWVYLVLGKTNHRHWKGAIYASAAAGIFQSLTMLFFAGSVCDRNSCSMGPGAAVSIVSALTWFILAFEMHYNSPIMMGDEHDDDINSPDGIVANLEMSDVGDGMTAFFRRVTNRTGEDIPTLNQYHRHKVESPSSTANSYVPPSYGEHV